MSVFKILPVTEIITVKMYPKFGDVRTVIQYVE